MIGQGSPLRYHCRCAANLRPGWLGRSVALAVILWCATVASASESTLRLRIAWGGGAERTWRGVVRLSNGSLSEVRPLGIEADEPGTIWLESDGDGRTVAIRQRAPRAYDGLDVLVTADLNARLTIELEAVDEPQPEDNPLTPSLSSNAVNLQPAAGEKKQIRPAEAPNKSLELALQDLISDSHKTQLDSTKNRLVVMRSPGDRLRVQFERDNLVFAPRDVFQLSIQPHLLGLPAGTPIRVKAQLVPVHLDGPVPKDRLWSKEFDAITPDNNSGTEAKALEVQLPETQGVYDLSIAVIDTRLMERLPWKKPLAERKVQFVVIDAGQPATPASADAAMTKVLEIDPANPRWFDRVANLPLLPSQRRGPLGSGEAARWEHPTLGPMIQLGKSARAKPAEEAADNVAWESYPLPISELGQPHILELEYPSDVPQALGISIVEPNAAGAVMPIGLDSGVYVVDEQADEPPVILKHRLIFWPRTKSPLLLATNRGEGAPAVYGKIRVLSLAPPVQFGMLGLAQKSSGHLPRALGAGGGSSDSELASRGRLYAGYLDRPLFVENFSAPESMDQYNKRSLDCWVTFYLGSQRLVEYLNHVGYNGLVMSVLADGSTIYPSTRLESTPKHDTGVFYATGQDPVQKDVLELVFRVFDREGLTLIPAVEFGAPLAELEKLKRQGPAEAVGVTVIGADGRSWVDRNAPEQGLAPYYNPLHPRVQEAMLGVVRELAERYRQHPSFGGLAVQLTANGFAQLPGADWGYDDDTVSRFATDASLDREDRQRLIAHNDRRFAVRAGLLRGKLKQVWLEWRAEQLAALHRRMQGVVNGELLLLGGSLFESPTAQRGLQPALPRRSGIDDVLLEFGLRPRLYNAGSGITLVRPYRIGLPDVTGPRGVETELNVSPDVDQLFSSSGGGAAALMYHSPIRTRLESFDEQSPFGKANTYTWLVSQFSPSGSYNRRRFVHSVAVQDVQSIFDGGWLLPLGQENALADFIRTYRQLPARPFVALEESSEPVTIRTLAGEGQTQVYFANDSPWRVQVKLNVEASPQVQLERIGPVRKLPPLVHEAGEGTTWTIELQPYDLVAAKFTAEKVRLTRPRVSLDPSVQDALARRIGDLSTRVAALVNPTPLPVLENPGFEAAPVGDKIPGWTVDRAANSAAEIVAHEHYHGKQSLRLSSRSARTSVRSAVIDPPATGRLSVALWLKTADKTRQPKVRLAVEGRIEGADYYRFAAVGGDNPAQTPLGEDWAQYIYQVDDLPSKGAAELRVRFDLMAAGEVWIDDVQVFDLGFAENERVELSKLVSLAEYKRSVGQYSGCLRLLDSYWPQFLVKHVPLTQGPGPVARRPVPQRQPVPPAESPKPPGMFNRFKSFVPRFGGG